MDSQRELNTALEYLVALSKEDHTKLQKKLYESFSALSYLALEGRRAKFRKGWAADLKDRHDDPLFSKDEADIVETVSLSLVKPLFEKAGDQNNQTGGKVPLVPSMNPSGILQSITVNPADISIDKTFWKVKQFLEGLDKQTHDMSRNFGPFRYFYETSIDPRFPLPVPIPVPPFVTIIPVPIPARAIPVMIEAFVEGIRLIMSVGAATVGLDPAKSDLSRKILSVVLSLIDLFKGEWKQSLLSFAGFFGQNPLILGLIGKVFLNVFNFISPDLQEKLIYDVYQSTKSLFMGSFLWLFSTVAPDFVRASVRIQFDKLKQIADNTNKQVDKVEESMQKSVQSSGLKIDFKHIPEDMVPTFDDIQNLQSIARQPAIYCSKEFQEAIQPLQMAPPARFILEMLNIPTDPDSVAMECKTMLGSSLDDTMEQLLTPQVTVDPSSPLAAALNPEAALTGLADKVPGAEAVKETVAAAEKAHNSLNESIDKAKATLDKAAEGTAAATAVADKAEATAKGIVKPEVQKIEKKIKKGGSRRRRSTRRQSRNPYSRQKRY
jgi:hypothetical protein